MIRKYKQSMSPLVEASAVLFICLSYSILRYNIYSDVPWIDLPLFVFNKSLALCSLILFAHFQYSKSKPNSGEKKYLREYAIIFIVLHILISVLILNPEYYPKFFLLQKLNITGVLSIFFGILAFGLLLPLINKNGFREIYNRFKSKQNVAIIFFTLTAAHVVIMGIKGWFEPSTWPGGLPPITLLSFIVALFPLIYNLIFRKD